MKSIKYSSLGEPHIVSEPSTMEEVMESDNKVIKEAYRTVLAGALENHSRVYASSVGDHEEEAEARSAEAIKIVSELSAEHTNSLEWGEVQGPMTWYEAKNLEKDDWRLPNVTELTSLFAYGKGEPKDEKMKDRRFWSSSSYAAYTDLAWHVHFSNGNVSYNFKYAYYYVRCVREAA